jgi:sec-independent protein translocase protein TatC
MGFWRQKSDEDLFRESTMTFGEHLEELRLCLFKAIVGLLAGTVVGFLVGGHVVNFIQSPLRNALVRYYQKQSARNVEEQLAHLREVGYALPDEPYQIRQLVAEQGLMFEQIYVNPRELAHYLQAAKQGNPPEPLAMSGHEDAMNLGELVPVFVWRRIEDTPNVRMKSLNAQETFMIYLRASLLVGVIVASPWIFYQIWKFVAAGLYWHERHFVYVFLPFSLMLFLGGTALAFFFVFEPVLDFLFAFNSALGIDPDPRINEWLGFVLFLPLGFGISFQLPLVMLFLHRIGIFTVGIYLSYWRVAILIIFVLAMVLTPGGDPYSMLLMALPVTLLYFGGILLCRFLPPIRRRPTPPKPLKS